MMVVVRMRVFGSEDFMIGKTLIKEEIGRRLSLIDKKFKNPEAIKGLSFWHGRGKALWDFLVWLKKNKKLNSLSIRKELYKRYLKTKTKLTKFGKKGNPFVGGQVIELQELLDWIKAKTKGG